MDDLVIGIVSGSFGVAGWCKVKSLSGETGHFLRLKEVRMKSGTFEQNLEVEGVKISGNFVLMKFPGIDNPEDAKNLTGTELSVQRAFAQALGAGEYYITDLCKCAVFCLDKRVGQVTGAVEGGSVLLLEARKDDGATVLIPFAGKFIDGVDLSKLRIDLTEDFLLL